MGMLVSLRAPSKCERRAGGGGRFYRKAKGFDPHESEQDFNHADLTNYFQWKAVRGRKRYLLERAHPAAQTVHHRTEESPAPNAPQRALFQAR